MLFRLHCFSKHRHIIRVRMLLYVPSSRNDSNARLVIPNHEFYPTVLRACIVRIAGVEPTIRNSSIALFVPLGIFRTGRTRFLFRTLLPHPDPIPGGFTICLYTHISFIRRRIPVKRHYDNLLHQPGKP